MNWTVVRLCTWCVLMCSVLSSAVEPLVLRLPRGSSHVGGSNSLLVLSCFHGRYVILFKYKKTSTIVMKQMTQKTIPCLESPSPTQMAQETIPYLKSPSPTQMAQETIPYLLKSLSPTQMAQEMIPCLKSPSPTQMAQEMIPYLKSPSPTQIAQEMTPYLKSPSPTPS